MIRRPPRSTRTATLFPSTTLFRSGVDPEGDKERVAALSGLSASHILPEAYRLTTPASPHLAARIDGVEIDLDRLALPQVDGPLVVEGAGGLMVPVRACRWSRVTTRRSTIRCCCCCHRASVNRSPEEQPSELQSL